MALVSLIKEWGPEVQRGKRKYSDARFVTSIIEQIETKEKPITDKQVEALVKEKMKQAIPLEVPIEVEIGAGENWLEAH